MQRSRLAVASLLLLSACGGGAGAAASCVAPRLVTLSPEHGPARTAVSMTVQFLHEGCNDTTGAHEERPRTVPVYFTQQHVETPVGTMTGAGRLYTATLRFDVPATATRGPAVLSLGTEHEVIGRFTVG